MGHPSKTFITLGVLFLLGLLTDAIGRRTRLPRVTLLLILGILIGPSGLHFLTPQENPWCHIVSNMALVMVGFLLGEKFSLPAVKHHGHLVLWLSITEVIATVLAVLSGLMLIGVPANIALLLAGIATATDPVATSDVVNEIKSDGIFSRTLMGIVAIDDAWGLIAFSLMLTISQTLIGQHHGVTLILTGLWEIGGALMVGIMLGIPMAYLTGRIKPGEPTLIEALGLVFLCGGIAQWLEVSFLLASMMMGTVVANLARHHTRPFHAIQGIEWPFMILFFMLAGASLHLNSLYRAGLIGSAYIVFRIIGRLIGSWVGGRISGAPSVITRWMGMALMPQAGVALGMALIAIQRRPELTDLILPIVVASTVLFEVIGPVLTRTGIVRAGEARLQN
ncbi:MAG: cation:proton antiporter [Desulfobacterales bacterium]|nr:cation:proton antiporter [Desulfobacterales bacterium]MDD4072670.1 cation:proton antiporter [Desulfobacterales bacterium]MDD4391779.1 cation:proton antiporter [Desulfobacterales bacterium]